MNWLILLEIRTELHPTAENQLLYLSIRGTKKNFIDYKDILPLTTSLKVLSNIFLSALTPYINKITEYH